MNYRGRIASGVTTMDPLDSDITTLGGQFFSLLDMHELSEAYNCYVGPACASGGIVFDKKQGVINGSNLNSECR